MSIVSRIIKSLSEAVSKSVPTVDAVVNSSVQHNDIIAAEKKDMEVVALLDAEINSVRFKYILYTDVNGNRGYKLIGSSGEHPHAASLTYTDCVGLWLHNIDTPEVLSFIAEKSTWPKNPTDPIGPGQILRPSKPADDESRYFEPRTISLAEAESMFRSSISGAIDSSTNLKDKEALKLLLLKLYGKTHLEVFNSYFQNPNEFSDPTKEATVSRALKEARTLIKELPGSPELPSWAAWRIPIHRETFYHEYVKQFSLIISD